MTEASEEPQCSNDEASSPIIYFRKCITGEMFALILQKKMEGLQLSKLIGKGQWHIFKTSIKHDARFAPPPPQMSEIGNP